jgi:hypothetical protein
VEAPRSGWNVTRAAAFEAADANADVRASLQIADPFRP